MSDGERKAKYEDLMTFPEHTRAEVVGGVVHVQPSTRAEHAYATGELFARLRGAGASGAGGWWFLMDVDTRLGPHDIVRPDLEGWRRERMPNPPRGRPIDVRPDWVCEVLSPSNVRYDRQRKMDLYAQAGIPHIWLVDPELGLVEAFALHDGRWLRLGAWGEGDMPRIPPFEGFELDVGALFVPEAEAPG